MKIPEKTPNQTLDQLALGEAQRIVSVAAPAHAPEWAQWLHDLGFMAGETVEIQTRALGGDPLAVKVAGAVFALRRAEAACISVSSVSMAVELL
jgi:ferrous iron transport protein A